MQLMPWSFALRSSLKSCSVTFLEAFKLFSLRIGKGFETEKKSWHQTPGSIINHCWKGKKKKEIGCSAKSLFGSITFFI